MPAASDNHRLAKKYMKQDAVYWPTEDVDAFGKPSWGSPVVIKCRWESSRETFINANGDEEVSRAKLIVDRDIEEKSVLLLGTLANVTDQDNPKENDGAWEVRLFMKTPDAKAKRFLREVYL